MFRNIFKKKEKDNKGVVNKSEYTINNKPNRVSVKGKYMCKNCNKDLYNSPQTRPLNNGNSYVCCKHCNFLNSVGEGKVSDPYEMYISKYKKKCKIINLADYRS